MRKPNTKCSQKVEWEKLSQAEKGAQLPMAGSKKSVTPMSTAQYAVGKGSDKLEETSRKGRERLTVNLITVPGVGEDWVKISQAGQGNS